MTMLSRSFPGLLTQVEGMSRPREAAERRESLLSYVSAYVVAAKLATKLGVADLAILAADRAAPVAVDAESDVARGVTAYQVACALLRADQPGGPAQTARLRAATRRGRAPGTPAPGRRVRPEGGPARSG